MVIIIDVDDVTADMLPVLLDDYNRKYRDWLTLEDVTDWDLTLFLWPDVGVKVWDLMTPEFYDRVQPMEGAFEGIERLRARGHRIVLKTAASRRHPGRKLKWLMEWSFLPEDDRWSADYIEARDVSLLRADVLVTDNPHEVSQFQGTAILFNRPWNRKTKWPTRARHWPDVVQMIDDLCNEAPVPTIVTTEGVWELNDDQHPDLFWGREGRYRQFGGHWYRHTGSDYNHTGHRVPQEAAK